MSKPLPSWYVPVTSLSAQVDLGDVMPGKVFPIREPSGQAYAPISRMFAAETSPNVYEPAVCAAIMIAHFDPSGAGASDWPAKDAKVDAWKTVAAALPKTAIDRIVTGCIVHFSARFEAEKGNE